VFAVSDEPISARKSFKNFAAKPVVRKLPLANILPAGLKK